MDFNEYFVFPFPTDAVLFCVLIKYIAVIQATDHSLTIFGDEYSMIWRVCVCVCVWVGGGVWGWCVCVCGGGGGGGGLWFVLNFTLLKLRQSVERIW